MVEHKNIGFLLFFRYYYNLEKKLDYVHSSYSIWI